MPRSILRRPVPGCASRGYGHRRTAARLCRSRHLLVAHAGRVLGQPGQPPDEPRRRRLRDHGHPDPRRDDLLDKPGGYLSNDRMPPSVLLDNMPNWELGVLQQVRDLARVIRNDYSRSQSQSKEDEDVRDAEPAFFIDSNSWLLPASESDYRDAIDGFVALPRPTRRRRGHMRPVLCARRQSARVAGAGRKTPWQPDAPARRQRRDDAHQ